jgi:photosystem II stability/assembly factor-like uncharacterized protein
MEVSVDRSFSRVVLTFLVLWTLVIVSLWPSAAAGRGRNSKDMALPVGLETFEPTLGATANGDLYFSITPSNGVAIGWRASIAKSTDGGHKWKDVGPTLPTGHSNPPETNDPYVYVDPATGRVFTFHMSPILTCSIMSFSDDGGKSWNTNPVGCSPTVVWDHQTLVSAKPREVSTSGYPNVLHECVNAVYAAMCTHSVDGGLTWSPSVPVHVNTGPLDTGEQCGAQHGHLANGPDGSVYLPTSRCGTYPHIYISRDDGQSWEPSMIAEVDTPFVDPTVSADSKGNLYAAFIDEKGWLYYATSRNDGKSWSKPIQVAQGYTTNMPVIVAGDPGKVVIAYPGTNDLPKGYKTKWYLGGEADQQKTLETVAWGANFTVSHNGLDNKPKFKTVVATGSDPIGRGAICGPGTRCDYLIDFIEAIIGPDGRPYASFVDGCINDCAKTWQSPQISGTGLGLMTTLQTGPRLCAKRCWRYKGASSKEMNLIESFKSAMDPSALQTSLGYTIERLSPELRALMREATQRRLEAVGY